MTSPNAPDWLSIIYEEFRRIGLNPHDLQGLAVSEPRPYDGRELDSLVERSRAAGFRVHGGGPIDRLERPFERHAYVVMERESSEKELFEFVDWLESQPGVHLEGIARRGDEEYL